MDGIFSFCDRILGIFIGSRRLRFRVHRAYFLATQRECFFLNLTNLSRDRAIEVTHVWLDLPGGDLPVAQPDRPLPKRLQPDETWETWIPVDQVPEAVRPLVFKLGRARLSTGKVRKSRQNRKVPSEGTIPGGPITQPPF